MTELSFVMKIKSINLGCYFGQPLYVNVVHSTTLCHQGVRLRFATRSRENFGRVRNRLRLRSRKYIGYFFKGWSDRFFRSQINHFFTTHSQVPSKTFRRLLVLSKAAGSGGSGSESGSAFLFATVGGMGPITFLK